MAYEKYIQDGKMAVLLNGDYGLPWVYDNGPLGLQKRTDRRIIEHFLSGGIFTEDWFSENVPELFHLFNGAQDLYLDWVPLGELFYVHEYDGSERIVFQDEFFRAE